MKTLNDNDDLVFFLHKIEAMKLVELNTQGTRHYSESLIPLLSPEKRPVSLSFIIANV